MTKVKNLVYWTELQEFKSCKYVSFQNLQFYPNALMDLKLHVLLFALLIIFSWPINASEFNISWRINNMQKAEKNMTLIKKSISESNYKQAWGDAQFIKNWANTMLKYFPKGSGASINNSSSASDEIWENFSLFTQFAIAKQNGAKQMMAAAKKMNKKLLLEAFQKTQETCVACHERFRN